ncbi:uncharacterized protein MYCGRDRAFT_44596 [Zymoseptoria tritici IPO323]|uniref:Kinesin-like protein KIP2 n=1 Tax=Zymoseptoria tritici (strain CBS 115943 / IPO323) TaxID=336722 RepID=F9XFS9_ZYMTI|nr:uncharacterized protein MYCGRDRAFT_44596 [Zymoseptoria tritici IPO323]EGP85680.1 hypothetical protein MYCGRDRAFT_44596 [Zymoseptoria tritici IPO323]
MTSTLPRTPRPPPTGPLPALPVSKTRRSSIGSLASGSDSRRTSTASQIPSTTPKKSSIPGRSVTHSGVPTPRPTKSNSTPTVPTVNNSYASDVPIPTIGQTGIPKTVRKVTSIGSFPMPPKGSVRVTSLPPSPLSASAISPTDPTAMPPPTYNRRDSSKQKSAEGGTKKPNSGLNSGTPSLLNGTGDSNLVAGGGRGRASARLLGLPSPSQSRSSSTNGSCIDEEEEHEGRGRSRSDNTSSMSKGEADGKSGAGNVLVSVRVRPDAGNDDTAPEGEWMVDGRRSLISYRGREGGDYHYDNVFSPHDRNGRVYDNAAKRLVRRVMEGYHGTVFAYGMTGTGKTFSMQGTANSPGVIPLAITDIFSYIRENPAREFLLRVSYLEIYNEKIYDLLNASTPGVQQEEIKLREDSKRGVYATPLKEEIVQSPNQLLRVIARGDLARRTSSTQFNARSSRSHAVVQIVVESRARTQEVDEKNSRKSSVMPGGVLVSTLSLIDLAGSEKAADTKERRTEGSHINKSLLTLGTVIGRLSGEDDKDEKDGAKGVDKEKVLKHLPYRDSKLTRLLQPALSGNSLVSILCTIQLSAAGSSAAQASTHTGETLNTLKFASRAKNNIVSHAKKNESNGMPGDPGSRALLDRYRIEIQELRTQLEQQNRVKPEADKPDNLEEQDRRMEEELERQERTRHEEQMLEMQLARTALKERISHLNRLILSSKSLGVNSGRFSTTSMPFDPRASQHSNIEYGRPSPNEHAVSAGSVLLGNIPSAQRSQLTTDEAGPQDSPSDPATPTADDEEDITLSAGDNDDGSASLAQQNRMLQADLADKNRYIATLEKRLLQARRTSHSRVSMAFAGRTGLPSAEEESQGGNLGALLKEKDRELDELRQKLDDQVRMVTALRSAARKREMQDSQRSATATPTATATSTSGDDTVTAPRVSSSRSRSRVSGPTDVPADTASDSVPDLTSLPFSTRQDRHTSSSSRATAKGGDENLKRRKSVDEMTALLDQMIQDKVESGLVVRGERGSLRVKERGLGQRASKEIGGCRTLPVIKAIIKALAGGDTDISELEEMAPAAESLPVQGSRQRTLIPPSIRGRQEAHRLCPAYRDSTLH